jgi:3-oxoacyl-[acyl-carrier-protein] synthase II
VRRAVLVLEERSRAVARGAKIYAEVVGHAYTNDAYHMTAPAPDGRQAARAMQLALADGHVPPTDVGYINAHGSSTSLNDPTETLAIKQVFGDHADRLTVSGTRLSRAPSARAGDRSRDLRAGPVRLAAANRQPRPRPTCDLDCLPRRWPRRVARRGRFKLIRFWSRAVLVLRPDVAGR